MNENEKKESTVEVIEAEAPLAGLLAQPRGEGPGAPDRPADEGTPAPGRRGFLGWGAAAVAAAVGGVVAGRRLSPKAPVPLTVPPSPTIDDVQVEGWKMAYEDMIWRNTHGKHVIDDLYRRTAIQGLTLTHVTVGINVWWPLQSELKVPLDPSYLWPSDAEWHDPAPIEGMFGNYFGHESTTGPVTVSLDRRLDPNVAVAWISGEPHGYISGQLRLREGAPLGGGLVHGPGPAGHDPGGMPWVNHRYDVSLPPELARLVSNGPFSSHVVLSETVTDRGFFLDDGWERTAGHDLERRMIQTLERLRALGMISALIGPGQIVQLAQVDLRRQIAGFVVLELPPQFRDLSPQDFYLLTGTTVSHEGDITSKDRTFGPPVMGHESVRVGQLTAPLSRQKIEQRLRELQEEAHDVLQDIKDAK